MIGVFFNVGVVSASEGGVEPTTITETPTVTCDGADYQIPVHANDDDNEPMWVVGDGCWTPLGVLTYRNQDFTNINVPAGNYAVKGIARRGNPGQSQTNESYFLEINSVKGATSTDDIDPDAQSLRLDVLGNFDFNGGGDTVYMNTAAKCPPDTHANSVEVEKLCLWLNEDCGNGIKEGDEECDGSAGVGEHQTCSEECTLENLPYCGDGTVNQTSEQCDDGNDDDNDVCANDCTLNTCGDGEVNNGEVCDDGTNNGVPCVPAYGKTCSYCSNVCSEIELTGPYCGDGVKNGSEQCDGNSGVGLNQNCTSQCILEDVMCEAELDVVFIMDRSGSMGWDTPTRLSQAKSAANSFADKLRSGDKSALVSYASTASLDKILSNNHIATKVAINSLSANGATNIGDAINLATQESISVRANPQAAKIQILLTDGKANKPNGSGNSNNPNGLEYLDVAYAITESTEAAGQGIIIFTIGLGNTADIDEAMLQTIANNTGGQYYHAPTGNDLDAIFNSIAHKVCEYGSISGCKYKDTNYDGSIIGEPKLSNWKINLTNGTVNLSQLTDQSGCYAFSGLSAGNYTIAEDPIQSASFVQTYPVSPSTYSITLSEGQEVINKDFGNYILECGNGRIDSGEVCDDGNTANGDGCSSTCQEETCEHDVAIRYTYNNSYGTGIAIRSNGGAWMNSPVQLTRNYDYELKYIIENRKSSPNNIHVTIKLGNGILSEYNSPINIEHSKIMDIASTTLQSLAVGTTTVSVLVEKNDGIDCNPCDNYAEREVEIIAICGDGIIDENLDEQCDDGNSINDDGCTNQCALPSGGPEYGSIKACKLADADGSLITNTDRTPVFGWKFILDDGAATTSQLTDQEIGCTVFSNLLTGNYEISETLGAGWVALWPDNGTSTVAVAANQETQINFINTKHGLISGYKFEDNDLASSTNALLPKEGWIINLAYASASTTLIASTTTDVNGYYEFTVMPGEYIITENMPANWGAVGSSSLNVIVTSGLSLTNNNFINHLFCGDGIVNQEVEQCDGSAGVGANQRCTAECKIENVPDCGDHTVNQSSEQCDDGNKQSGDGCSSECKNEGGGGGGTFIATNGGGGGGGPIVLGETGEPILTIEKSVNMKFANPGDEVEYRVKIINHGNLTAFNVTLNDTLPAGFTFSADGSSVKTITVGDLGPGENKEFVYKAKVSDKTVSGIYANVAQAVASNHNPVSDYADVEVKEIEVLGAELAPTGFSVKEFALLVTTLFFLSASAIMLRRKYRYSL
jgi:uncharacterized repeat protein (TIGR01451 family)